MSLPEHSLSETSSGSFSSQMASDKEGAVHFESTPPMRSPMMERMEQGTALTFAQHRARVNGMHVEECLRLLPILKTVQSDLDVNALQIKKLIVETEGLSVSSAQADRDWRQDLLATHTHILSLLDRIEAAVTCLEEVRDKDRSKRLSMEALSHAVSEALGSDRRISPSALSDVIPPPLALAPPAKKRSPSISLGNTAVMTPVQTAPVPGQIMVDSHNSGASSVVVELSEVRIIQIILSVASILSKSSACIPDPQALTAQLFL